MKVFFMSTLIVLSVVAVFAQPADAADFVLIKGGTFTMGSPAAEAWREKDEIQHSVTVSDFHLAQYEVTQREYVELMSNNPSNFKE